MYGSKLGPNAEKKVRDQIMRTLGWRKTFWSRKLGQLASREPVVYQKPSEGRKDETGMIILVFRIRSELRRARKEITNG